MADETRTREVMKIVSDIVDAAEDFSRPLTKLKIFSFQPPETDPHFANLVSRVEEAVTGGKSFLSDQRRQLLSQSFAEGLRVFGFYDSLDLPYVLTLRGMQNIYDATIVIDMFSARALWGLLGPWEPRHLGFEIMAPPSDPRSWPDFRHLVDQLAAQENAVQRVGRKEAARNFTTLFVDTLRGLAGIVRRAIGSSISPTTIKFTVHSGPRNYGYALWAFPQYRYQPTSFGGSQLSTPVVGDLQIGHWCFEGTLMQSTSMPIRDRGTHFVGPGSTSTQTTSF